MELPVRHITLPRGKEEYARVRSLSESLVRRELARQGYTITRGSMLDAFFEPTRFDDSDNALFVRWHLARQTSPRGLIRIAKYCARNHGTPDLLCAHAARGVLAVEVKLGHERIMPHQLENMRRLMAWGVPCEVWRVMPRRNKVREKQIDLGSWSADGDVRAATAKTVFERAVTVYGRR